MCCISILRTKKKKPNSNSAFRNMLWHSLHSNLISMLPFPCLAILTALAKLKDIAQGVPLCPVWQPYWVSDWFICKGECFLRPVKGTLDTFEPPLQTGETLRVSLRAITERKWLPSERPRTLISNERARCITRKARRNCEWMGL